MTHKDAPPETPSQAACREWWTKREPHRARAKFEAWWEENYFYVHEKLASLKEYAWMGWQAAHTSRDAEVEALREDAEIGRYVLKYAAWIRDGDDTIMEIRFAGHVDLSSVGTRRNAIDAAMAIKE